MQGISNYFKSFSGTDTLVFIMMPSSSPILLGSLTTISYSLYRTKQPVVNLGRTNINGVARGTRIYAGTMIFTLINQHWLNELLDTTNLSWMKKFKELKADELPLFDLIVISANEYGNSVSMMLYGVDITDEAQVISVEDLFTENTLNFIARDIDTFKAHTIVDSVRELNVNDDFIAESLSINDISVINNNISSYNAVRAQEEPLYQDKKKTALKAAEDKKQLSNYRELTYNPVNTLYGDDVAKIQRKLVNEQVLQPADVTHIYDKETEEAVKQYQSKKGLPITGVVDKDTFLSLLNSSNIGNEESGQVVAPSAYVYEYPNKNSNVNAVYQKDSLVKILDTYDGSPFMSNGIEIEADGERYYKTEQGYVNVKDVYSFDNPEEEYTYPVLQYGDSGYQVTMLQTMLQDLEYDVVINGNYNGATQSYVKKFQKENGLDATGIVNEDTWRVLEQLSGTEISQYDKTIDITIQNKQGHYSMTPSSIDSDLFNGFNIKATSHSNAYLLGTLISYFEGGDPKVISKQYDLIANQQKDIPFSDFKDGFMYDPELKKYPNKLEYVIYLSNNDIYKYIINYKGDN